MSFGDMPRASVDLDSRSRPVLAPLDQRLNTISRNTFQGCVVGGRWCRERLLLVAEYVHF